MARAGTCDGSLIAWATHTEGRSAGDGILVIIDGRTGQVLFELDTAEAVARVAFDPGAPELVAVLVDGSLMTVDLVREEVAFDVPTTLPPRTTELDVRADGAIVAVSAGQVALLNRETGRVTNQIDLQSVENSRYRPDGTLLTVRSDDQIEVLSLEGNALVDQVWDFPAESRGISDGFAAGVGANGPVVLDLGTGGQRAVNPQFPSGGSDLHRLFGDATGYVAVGDREIGRWEIDRLVESVHLEGDFRGCHCEGDMWPVASERVDGTMKVDLVQTRRGQMGSLFEVDTPHPVIGGAATPNGGMWLIDSSGELRTYDAAGALISQLQTELSATALAGMRRGDYDPTGNRSVHQYQADAAAPGGVVLLDHVAGTVETIVEGQYESVEFAHDGRVLVLVHLDGTVWLWDVEHRRSIGAAWNGASAVTGTAVWSDETTSTIWAHVDNQVVQLPVAAEGWAARACEIVGRDLTQEEWDRWVPGNHARQSACR